VPAGGFDSTSLNRDIHERLTSSDAPQWCLVKIKNPPAKVSGGGFVNSLNDFYFTISFSPGVCSPQQQQAEIQQIWQQTVMMSVYSPFSGFESNATSNQSREATLQAAILVLR
jgi:hypothetical protein